MSAKQTKAILKKFSPILWQIIFLGISLFVYYLILVNRSPGLIRSISMSLRTGFGIVIPLATLVIYAAYRIPGRIGELFAITATMSLFALALAGLWAAGSTQSVVLNGLIPLTDASAYYVDATRIQYGMDISNFSAMRPFFAGLLSFFLWLSERNLMTAVAIFTAIAGFSCFLATREIQRTHGTEIAVFFLILMFLYYRHHSGTTMSETLGVAVSLLGVALLWRGITLHKEWLALFGIGMITLALNIRPGAMFVLPALLLWGGWIFRGQGKFSFKFFGLGAVVILLAFYANKQMINILAGPGGIPFENFAWAFYGLASGGKSWTYIFQAHPELRLLSDAEVTPAIYKLAFEQIRSNPLLLIQGSFFYWRMFFSNTWYNAYAFAAGDNYWVNLAARWGMYLLGGLGIFKWIRDPKNPYTSLAFVTALGVLASVPFVPPTDAYRVRLYAATIPFFVLLPAMGILLIQEWVGKRFPKIQSIPALPEGYPVTAFSVIVITVMIVSPIWVKTNGKLPTFPTTACPAGTESFYTSFDKGTSVNIYRENKVFLDWMPDFHVSGFRNNAHDLPDANLITAMNGITPPSTLFYALDLQTNQEAILVVETDLLPQPGTLVQFCGRLDYNPDVTPYPIFHAEQVNVVQHGQ